MVTDGAAPDARRTVDLSIVFPAYNESAGIERAIAAALEAGGDLMLAGEIDTFEVVVVDDGSVDDTAAIVARLASEHPEVVGVEREENGGLGAAVRTGFERSCGELVLYTDADLPFDLHDLHKAIRLARHYDADIVSAYRHDRTGEGVRRLVYSYLYNTFIHTAFGLRIRDVNFAGKLVRRCVLDAVTLQSNGSFIDVELLARAERRGFAIVQFGVDYFPRSRGVSTLSSVNVIREMMRAAIQLGPSIRAEGPRRTPL